MRLARVSSQNTPDAVRNRLAEYPATIKPARQRVVGEKIGK